MNNEFTIVREVLLPSMGKVYSKDVTPIVKLRSMTTVEEMKRLNHSDTPYKLMSEVIQDCIVSDLEVPVYELCIADYQFLLNNLRIVTYGPEYSMINRCPYCYAEEEKTMNLEDLVTAPFVEETYKKYSEFELPQTHKKIKIRLQSPKMLDEITARSKQIKKQAQSIVGDPAFLVALESMIETVDGEKLEKFKLTPFLQNLPMMDTNYILKSSQKLNSSFGINPTFVDTCGLCGLTYTTNFRITSEFFGPDIE